MKCQHFERRAAKPRTHLDDMLQLWRDVAVATAGSDNCVKETSPGKFAKQVVEHYAEFLLAIDKARNE